ncbi:hypothetical protein [Prauserella cavernicola]|uniref:DUF5666 domain-containing protein n=1 Tax=Prauserella cavernicola TaxID=2800127 RepID=A0A934V285_9PSEU|nr:hypothetical protein [Prauserella cavernicola]MBK1785021.1 hypothetical protein [Prauserella cavernicola]
MSTENALPESERNWGDPQPPREHRPRWTARRTTVAVAVAAGIALAGGVAVYAGASGGSGQDGMRGGPPGTGGQFGPQDGMSAMADALHGDFTVAGDDGGYETQRVQKGEVTAIDDTSVTVESEDGYTRTYAIDEETEQPEETGKGEVVTVLASVAGDEATATSITTGTDGFPGAPGGTGPGQQGGPQGAPPGQQGGPGDAN